MPTDERTELIEALQSCLEWMEFTILNLDRYKVPHRLNWGGPIGRARQALANATGKPCGEYIGEGGAILPVMPQR